jgi:hypothetical protein
MAKSTSKAKESMLILGCVSIFLCVGMLFMIVLFVSLYLEAKKGTVILTDLVYFAMLRDLIKITFLMALFLGYAAWVALKNRKHLREYEPPDKLP